MSPEYSIWSLDHMGQMEDRLAHDLNSDGPDGLEGILETARALADDRYRAVVILRNGEYVTTVYPEDVVR